MRMSNKYLKKSYDEFNKKYFSNELPKDMVVRFSRLRDDDKFQEPCGITMFKWDRPLYILINKKLRWQSMLADFTLIHEMVHVAHPEINGHGPRFQKQMMRLAKAGAFKTLW
jgi:hypothetical protein